MQSMLRWLTVLAVIGGVTAGILVLALGLYQGPSTLPPPASTSPTAEHKASQPVLAAPPVEQVAQAAEPQPNLPAAPLGNPLSGVSSRAFIQGKQVVIPDGHITLPYKQDVPSQRAGQLLYVATEPKPGEVIPPDRLVKVDETYAYVEVEPGEKVPPGTATVTQEVDVNHGNERVRETRVYRRLLETDVIDPKDLTSKVIIRTNKRELKLLKEGDEVKENDLLALVDPRIQIDDYVSKATAVEAAKADRLASAKTRDEAEQRYRTMERLYNTPGYAKTVSLEDVRGAKLTWDKYYYEEVGKRAAITKAEAELSASLTLLKMHEIRAKISGIVKAIYKQRGEAVKGVEQGGDQVALINDVDHLRIEGMFDVQYIGRLNQGDKVFVEPSQPKSPLLVFTGHLQQITGVAVSKDFRIVSSSADSVHVWDRHNNNDVEVPTPSATLCVACSPPEDQEHNLLATGGADGIARVWDLNNLREPVAVLENGHHRAVTAVAFSPDGAWIATGYDDNGICLWDRGGRLLQGPLTQGHNGGITSVKFLARNKLVTAGKDFRLVIWTLDADGKPSDNRQVLDNRSGKVAVLGVNPKAGEVLFDQGTQLRLLSAGNLRTTGVLENAGGNLDFTTMALFSPNGNLVLTNAHAENRVQLWRVPTAERRAYELRQLVWPGQPITCGAFSPPANDGEEAFIVTGTEDHAVVVWQMPKKDEINQELVARVTYVDKQLDTASRQVRVWAEMDNKGRRLYPGISATMVEYPKKKK